MPYKRILETVLAGVAGSRAALLLDSQGELVVGAGDLGELYVRVAEMELGQLVEPVAVEARLEDVGEHHRVVDRRYLDAVAAEHLHVVFEVVADLEHAGIFEQRLQELTLEKMKHRPEPLADEVVRELDRMQASWT